MADEKLIKAYNYESFIPQNFEPWMRWEISPAIGVTVENFPLWHLDESQTTLKAVLKENKFTVVEFGSFT